MGSEQKHTPGPWVFKLARINDAAPIFGFAIKAPGKIPHVASAGVSPPDHALIVPQEFRAGITTGFDEAEVEANARLIAAAPDLLAALQRAILIIEATDEGQPELVEFRAAVKKAEAPNAH